MRFPRRFFVYAALTLMVWTLASQVEDAALRLALDWIDQNQERIIQISDRIGEFAEVGLLELKTSDLLNQELRGAGFRVTQGVAGLPTALVATFGTGQPVIGIIADLDAVAADPPRHGCGHNLMTAACFGTALALKESLSRHKLPGTVKFFGCPAEEEYIGKVYMARAGVFDGLDAVLAWHPSKGWAANSDFNALVSAKVRFHQAEADEEGIAPRLKGNPLSAALELGSRVNAIRQKIFEESRATADFVLTRGGEVPTATPETAEVWFMLVAPDRRQVQALYQQIQELARASAAATRTRVETQFLLGTNERLRNEALTEIVYRHLTRFAPREFSQEELGTARQLMSPFPNVPEELFTFQVRKNERSLGSADRGEVSWLAPMTHVHSHSWPEGAPRHSRVQSAIARMSIGHQTMLAACRTLTAVGMELLTKPEELAKVRKEFEERTRGFSYRALLPEGSRPPTAQDLWGHAGVKP